MIVQNDKHEINMEKQTIFNTDVSILISGAAGQGIQTVETLITRTLREAGHTVFSTKEYMSRVRGGSNSVQIRVSENPVFCPTAAVDLCVPLDASAFQHVARRLSDVSHIVSDKANVPGETSFHDIPFAQYAEKFGDPVYTNTIVAGFIVGLFRIEHALLDSVVQSVFADKGTTVLEKNARAAGKGWEEGKAYADTAVIAIDIQRTDECKESLYLSGHETVGFGAIAGGCNFISSYPMSPATGVLHFLAQQARDFEIVVDQAEDEISAINMALGSWYAGGRALVSTSGGGFALMGEGLSLAGCSETPVVIHLAQRPGPATGLPTRTEQGDLNLALYAGHGEFPRVILTPGSIEDIFQCTYTAFNIADKYQIPVIILTDQYLLDSHYTVPALDVAACKNEYFIVDSSEEYKRYALSPNGISPRSIPGHGAGLVCVDSDEHNEDGAITEDSDMRVAMVNKRLQKHLFLQNDALLPELIGSVTYSILLIGWGSTYHAIKEAVERMGRDDIAFLYCKQVYPLADTVNEYLDKAEKRIIIENNATAQFGSLLERELGVSIDECVLKYNGLPFSVEELIEAITPLV